MPKKPQKRKRNRPQEEKPWASELKRFREAKNLSQTDLARQLDVTPSLVSMWEKGSRKPEPTTFLKLAMRAPQPWDMRKFLGFAGIDPHAMDGMVATLFAGSLEPTHTNSVIRVYESSAPISQQPDPGWFWVPKAWTPRPESTVCIHVPRAGYPVDHDRDNIPVGHPPVGASSLSPITFKDECFLLIDQGERLAYDLGHENTPYYTLPTWAFWLNWPPLRFLDGPASSGVVSDEEIDKVWPPTSWPKNLITEGVAGLCVGQLKQVWSKSGRKTLFLLSRIPLALAHEEPLPFHPFKVESEHIRVLGKVIGVIEKAAIRNVPSGLRAVYATNMIESPNG
jgi:transcriptional regulator with XRE-family HTH domain